jgi:hypothetical protein
MEGARLDPAPQSRWRPIGSTGTGILEAALAWMRQVAVAP